MSKINYQTPPSLKDKKKYAHFLSEDEEMILLTGLSHRYVFQRFILYFALITLPLVLLAVALAYFMGKNMIEFYAVALVISLVLALVKTYLLKASIQYILTNKRLVIQHGFFSIRLSSAPYNKITYIEVSQNLWERYFLKYGGVKIHTAGIENKEIVLNFLEAPMEFKNILESKIHQEKSLVDFGI